MAIFSSPSLRRPAWTALIAFVFICLILKQLNTAQPNFHSSITSLPQRWRSSSDGVSPHLASIQNETLGFEKIWALNLPERSDKRDALVLAGSLTNLTIAFEEGVRGDQVTSRARPADVVMPQWQDHHVGSWRAHMNAIRRIVDERRSSVLILEDVVDWDIRIKAQLVDFARGSRFLLDRDIDDKSQHSPYGDGWDVLWLGHCYDDLSSRDGRTYALFDDPSVPQVAQLRMQNPEILQAWPPHTRVVHRTGQPLCTYAYAVSFHGAQKLLWAMSVRGVTGFIDNALSDWCHYDPHATCLSAHPSYFMSHRVPGVEGKNSDGTDLTPALERAETWNIRWSTRLNIEPLLHGMPYLDSYPDSHLV